MLGHCEIKQKDIRLQFACQSYAFSTVRRFTDDLMVRFRLEQTPQAITEDGVIGRDHKANLWLFKIMGLIPFSRPP
jgi:hypothetical protein